MDVLRELGAEVSPDLDAYASGLIPIQRVRCVLCRQAPCECRFCTVVRENVHREAFAYWREQHGLPEQPQFEVCDMRIDPATGECPRGHRQGGPADNDSTD